MASEDTSTTIVPLTKRPVTRKHRIHSHSQSLRETFIEKSRINRTLTATNRPSSKLPNLLTNDNIYSSTPGSMQCKRSHTQSSIPSKLERQSTNINLPTLYSLTSDFEQKRTSEFRRRQIYALNHLMRELEQAQFRQFSQLQNVDITDDTNPKPST